MSLKARIQEDMKAAMRTGDKNRLGCIRLIMAAVKQREVDERITLDDTQLLGVLEKMGKQRRESITLYDQGGRPELAEKERSEIVIIERFLPKQLSDAELEQAAKETIAAVGAQGIKDMGRTMAALKERYAGQMDGAKSSQVVKRLLTGARRTDSVRAGPAS